MHFAVMAHPTTSCVPQQLWEAFPFGLQLTYLFRDNDQIYRVEASRFLTGSGINKVVLLFAVRGKIRSWRDGQAAYGGSCWIT
jgi:hypothetical protein